MRMPKVNTDFYPLGGGLDLVTPAIALKPGRILDSQNYEPAIGGGYSRINGFERFDGQASPTSKSYWIISINLTGTIAVGNTVTGLTSAATGKVLAVVTGYLVLGRVSGTFVTAEALQVAAVTQATSTSAAVADSATTSALHADYKLLSANDWRTLITTVPGSGRIRGVHVYNDVVYAFRDNAGATAKVMHKSTSSGWSAITLPTEISFGILTLSTTVTISNATPGVVTEAAHGMANGQPIRLSTTGALPTGLLPATTYYVVNKAANTYELAATVGGASIATTSAGSGTHTRLMIGNTIAAGSTVTGRTSGATGVVAAALLRTGTWTVAPVGTLVLTGITGTFQSGEGLSVAGLFVTQTTSLATAITLAVGGVGEYFNHNFSGSTATTKMYGCDGVNPAFEFDGTNYIPIHTGMTTDTPLHVTVHKNHLMLSFLGSHQSSGIGNPYAWSVVTGASEINLSKSITGYLPQSGTASGAALAIFTSERTHILYGSSSADFALVPSTFDVGFSPYTMQQVGNDAFGLTALGIQKLMTTKNYGNFAYGSVSHMIQPLMTLKRGLETASCVLKTKNQYRVYFSDNTGLAVGLTGDKISGITVLNYGMPVRCMVSATLSTGAEVTYFGSDDGYVYMDNTGTSFDGDEIEAWMRLPFNNNKSPRVRKRFRRAILEVDVEEYVSVNISYDLGYGNPDVAPAAATPDQAMTGGGGYWDSFIWESFNWDAQVVSNPSISIDGTEKSISLTFYSNRAQDKPHTVQGVTLLTTPQRLENN